MSHNEFQRLVCLAEIDPTKFGGREHLVSVVQRQGIRKNDGSKLTTTVSAQIEIEKKRQYQKRKLDMDMSAIEEGLGKKGT